MKEYDGILSKVFYREFLIPAGIPISVHNAYIGLSNSMKDGNGVIHTYYEGSCKGRTVTFTAQAGRDYEVVPTHNSRSCGVAVRDITSGKSETL